MANFSPGTKLRAVKAVHTAAWAFFATAILAVPIAAWLQAWRLTLLLVALVSLECITIAWNGMQCPLTPIAARFTDDRAPNFDIYLPAWLARYNKHIFGTLFLAGCLFALGCWLRRGR